MSHLKAINYIVVHCSDSPNLPNDGRLDSAEDIHRWHLERGWSGIGYHWVIDERGELQAGRPEYWQGAGVKNRNHECLHVCLIGEGHFAVSQWATLETLVLNLERKYPSAKVVGHRDLDNKKTCPNFDVQAWRGTL